MNGPTNRGDDRWAHRCDHATVHNACLMQCNILELALGPSPFWSLQLVIRVLTL